MARTSIISYLIALIAYIALPLIFGDIGGGMPFWFVLLMIYIYVFTIIFFFVWDFVKFCFEMINNAGEYNTSKLLFSLLLCIAAPILLFGLLYFVVYKFFDIDVNLFRSALLSLYIAFPSDIFKNSTQSNYLVEYLSLFQLIVSKIVELLVISAIVGRVINLKSEKTE